MPAYQIIQVRSEGKMTKLIIRVKAKLRLKCKNKMVYKWNKTDPEFCLFCGHIKRGENDKRKYILKEKRG